MIYFDPIKHRYTDQFGIPYRSVTQLIHLYVEPFDEEYWSLYKALGNLVGFEDNQKKEWSSFAKSLGFSFKEKTKEVIFELGGKLNKSVEDIYFKAEIKKTEWKEKNRKALEKGTNYHNQKEEEDRKKYENWKDYTGHDLTYPNLISNVYPELRLYNHKYQLAGTADRVIIQDKIVEIEDYKTNESLSFSNFHAKMKYPLDFLDDCNGSHYTIQLNLYAYMLNELGYDTKALRLIYKEKPIEIELMPKTIQELLHHYRDNYLFEKKLI